MKTNQGLMAAVMAIAMLALPVAASAHPPDFFVRHGFYNGHGYYHNDPAYNRMYRPAAPMGFAPRPYAYNPAPGYYSPTMTPGYYAPGYAAAAPYAAAPYASAPMMPAAPCAAGMMPDYMAPAYNYATPYYGGGMPNGLANMIRARNNADAMYAQALRNHNGVRAHHLANDIAQLNKNIAHARTRDGIGRGYGSFAPARGAFSNRYAYGNNGFGSLAPYLGNFIR